MVIGNGFFSYTEAEAREEMEKIAGVKVLPCAFPTIGNLKYYISERGDVFSMQVIKGHYLTRGPKKAASLNGHGKRKDGGVSHRLSYAPGREKWVPCELLVYCTFTLRQWEPEVKLEFVNGRANDIRPDNIRPCKPAVPSEWTERMAKYQKIYKREFINVAYYIKYRAGLDLEDAKDVAQSTFIWLTTSGFKEEFSSALWNYWGLRRGLDYKRHFITKIDLTDFYEDEDKGLGVSEHSYEVDLVAALKGEKRQRYLRLWCQSHTPTQIAEMCNTTIGNVGASITHSIRFLQRYLKNEIKSVR